MTQLPLPREQLALGTLVEDLPALPPPGLIGLLQGRRGQGKQHFVFLNGSEETRQHLRVIGRSGSGKSRFLTTLVPQKLRQGHGVAFLDPHGDSVDLLLGYLLDSGYFADRRRAFEKLLYVDLARQDRFLPLNILQAPAASPRQIASLVLEAFKRAFPTVAGGVAPNFEQVLLSSVYVLSRTQQTLTRLPRLLSTDASYREQLLSQLAGREDADVLGFFHDRFGRQGKWAVDLNDSTLRRIFLFTWSPALSYSLGQPTNRLPFRTLMDQGISVLVNLGGLPPDAARFLGALLCVGFEQATLSRVDLPAERRAPYTLIADEAPLFMDGSEEAMQNILAQARKYALQLVLAQQYLRQSSSGLEGALQNALQVVFRIGREDAVEIAPRLHRYDPSRIRQKPIDPLNPSLTVPAFASETDQLHGLQQRLMTLPSQEAIVFLGEQALHFKALGMPQPQATREQITELKEEYARRLLTPREQIVLDGLDDPATADDETDAQQLPGRGDGVGRLRRRVELPHDKRTEDIPWGGKEQP
jgi:hypothetical protein